MTTLELDPEQIAFLDGNELLEPQDAQHCVIPGVLPRGGLCVITGTVDAEIKTDFAFDLALSSATGGTALDGVECQATTVVYVHFGKSRVGLAAILDRKAQGRNLKNLRFAEVRNSSLEQVRKAVEAVPKGSVLVLDGLCKEHVVPGFGGRRAWLMEVADICLSGNTAILAVLPQRVPATAADSEPLTRPISGTAELANQKGALRLTVSGRDFDVSRFDFFGTRWVRRERATFKSEAQCDIIEYLRDAPKRQNKPREIARALGVRPDPSFLKRIRRLAESGEIEHDAHGTYSHREWHPSTDQDSEGVGNGDQVEAEESSVIFLADDVGSTAPIAS